MIAVRGLKMPVNCSVCFGRGAIWCRFDENDRIVVPALPDESFEGRPEWCPLVDVPDMNVGNCSEIPNNSTDCISRQDVILELPSVHPEQRYTEEELRVFKHGISLSLLSKRSSQHWKYDEDTATEIKFLERLYEKVVADMRGEQE